MVQVKNISKLNFEGEYIDGKRWNGKGYDYNGNVAYEIKEGKGNIKEYYYDNGKLEFEGEYLMEKEMVKEKNIIMKTVY